MIKCRTAQQIRTLLSLTSCSDGKKSISTSPTLLPLQGSKGVLYHVPLDLTTEELQESLKTQNVTFTKRFKYFSRDTRTLQDSTTVLVHFSRTELPADVKIGYMLFKVKYLPKPVRCFKCNRYGHVANHCRGKERCSNCSGEHGWKTCTASYKRCPNCQGEHSATDMQCPRFKRETEVIRIKTTSKVAYAEACRQYTSTNIVTTPRVTQPSDFPPLTALPCVSPVTHRPLLVNGPLGSLILIMKKWL